MTHSHRGKSINNSLAIVMPALGEIENLRWLLPAIRENLSASGVLNTAVLVVTGIDTDNQELFEIEHLGGTPLRRTPSNSFGDAVRTGIANLPESATWVIFMDADGSHSPASIPALFAASSSADVVVSSRYVRGGNSDNPYYLRWMSRGLNWAFAATLGLKCRDVSTNFKRYRVSDLRQMELSCRDFDIIEEILFQIKCRYGSDLNILEIPDRFFERKFGKTKRRLGIYILSYFRTLLRLRSQHRAQPK